ncbi:MAG: ribonuclease P protein component [Candidatus Peribacteraceae bacterium]
MKLDRLRGRKITERVLRKGRVWKGQTMAVRSVWGAPRHPAADPLTGVYLGIITSAKLDASSVRRNRMRRRCREAWRTALQSRENLGPVQLLIAPRSSSLRAPFVHIQQDVERFLATLSHGRPPAQE